MWVEEEDYMLALGKPPPKPPVQPPVPVPGGDGPLLVELWHEYFTDSLVISWSGQSEEATHVEALEWFRQHGAKDMDSVNDAINQAWNFARSQFWIKEPKQPQGQVDILDPKV